MKTLHTPQTTLVLACAATGSALANTSASARRSLLLLDAPAMDGSGLQDALDGISAD